MYETFVSKFNTFTSPGPFGSFSIAKPALELELKLESV